jgi:hypothetical protein
MLIMTTAGLQLVVEARKQGGVQRARAPEVDASREAFAYHVMRPSSLHTVATGRWSSCAGATRCPGIAR